MIKFCKLRNIQLDHSRTIITIFMRMLTTPDFDIAAVAGRLLEHLPKKLQKQTQSYTKMIQYLEHLSKGGKRRVNDDVIAASVYTSRSAAFSELKANASDACEGKDLTKLKEPCQAMMDNHAEIAALWNIKPGMLKFQNMKAYQELLTTDLERQTDDDTKSKTLELTRKVLGDAEKWRTPWQVGKPGEFNKIIEPLDEAFLHEILTGETPESNEPMDSNESKTGPSKELTEQKSLNDEFAYFKSAVQTRFISTMQRNLTPEDVCGILGIPVATMRVFANALNPDFEWERLSQNFKVVVLGLLRERSNRVESRPVRKLFELKKREKGKGVIEIEIEYVAEIEALGSEVKVKKGTDEGMNEEPELIG